VSAVDGGGQNPLPWSGTADSTVTLDEAATPEQVLAVAEAALAQIAQGDGDLTATLEQRRGDVLLTLALDERGWVDVDLLRGAHEAAALIAQGAVQVRPVDPARPESGERIRRAEVQVDGGSTADLPALLLAHLALDGWDEASLALWSADGRSGYQIDPLTPATAEPVAVLTTAQVPVLGADLGATGGTLRVPPRSVPDARRVLAEALPGLDLTVTAQQVASVPAPGTPTTAPTS
jgi:hypothetical protein